MIGNSDELFEKQILSMPCIIKSNYLSIQALRENTLSLKYFLDEEKSLEKFCTEKVFKHVMSKKNLLESKNCKSLIRAGVPLKYMSELLIKLFNDISENKCSDEILNFNNNKTIVLKNHNSENFNEYVPYLSGFKTLKESLPINYLNNEGILKLKEILWMTNAINSNIEFSPIIIKLISLLLIICNQDETYAIIYNMIEINSNIQETSKIRWHIRFNYLDNKKIISSICESLLDISNKSGKETFNHFENINFPAEKLYEDMVFGFFMDYLSFSGVLRLLPFFLLEGVKSLYRMCYAIVKTLRLNILQINNPDEVIKKIREKSKEITDLNKLFNLAFGYKLTRKNNKYDFQKPIEKDVFATRRNSYYLPTFTKSNIITDQEFLKMWAKFPELLRAKDAKLIFYPQKDGYSLKSVYNLANENEYNTCMLFLIKTEENEVFGGFISNLFRLTGGKFIKPYDSYLVTVRPNVEVFTASKKSENILLCENEHVMFGNGDKGPAIFFSENLEFGRSNPENCFIIDKLVTAEDGSFKIAKFEIYLLE